MGGLRLFVDFGSTFTKVCALDLEREELAGWAKAPSTVDSDVTKGLEAALQQLAEQVPFTEREVREAEACSSAAGGLRIACVGLTEELTLRAAKHAAFGAGGKVVGAFAHPLTAADCETLTALQPDVLLLAGGTDGGDKRAVTANAAALASLPLTGTVLYCGNKSAADEVGELFAAAGKSVEVTGNILPALSEMSASGVNEKVRALFLSRITASRGIDRAEGRIGRVCMPTPSAVMEAARLLADGLEDEPGLGELLLVDVGGATTDVVSVCEGLPARPGVNPVGLREPRLKRTVEGDLGLYHNLDTLTEGESRWQEAAGRLRRTKGVPGSEEDRAAHMALTRRAVAQAVHRHCGTLEPLYTGQGVVQVQRGKDLTGIPTVIGAGGPIVFSPDRPAALSGVLRREENALMPVSPRFYCDELYILFAAGLLSRTEPKAALRLMKKTIHPVG